MFQSEARRLKVLSEAMHQGLRVQQRALGARIAALEEEDRSRGGEVLQALLPLRELSAMMLTESGDWKILYQTHEVHAG